MQSTRLVVSMWAVLSCLVSTAVVAQNYPNKPIRIVATEAGGSGDFMARLITPVITGPLGQPLVVENRSGANVTGEIVGRANPDGYTLLVIGSSFWLGPLLQKTPYDPVKEFAPIILMNNSPHIMAVNPSVPAKSVKEFIALAKAKPGELNYAVTAAGGAIHLAAELFKSMAGLNMVGVPYKGTAQAVTDVLGGQIQLMFPPAGVAAPFVKSGKLRALAITTAQTSPLFPELPTVAASGLPGYEAGNKNGMFAPAKTPAAIINRLNQETNRALEKPDIKEKLFISGIELVGGTPEQFAAVIKTDMTTIGKLIKDTGIKVE